MVALHWYAQSVDQRKIVTCKMVLLHGASVAKNAIRLCMQMWHWHASGLIVRCDLLAWTPVITRINNVNFSQCQSIITKTKNMIKTKYSKISRNTSSK